MKIAIIGHNRGWGNFFHRYLASNGRRGYEFLLRDKGTGEELVDIAKEADAIFIAAPMPAIEGIISELGPLRRSQLLIDVASRKVESMRMMMATKASVLGLHPLRRAPEKKVVVPGHTIVACRGRTNAFGSWIDSFLEGTEATILWTAPKMHDHVMRVEQNPVFQSLLAYAITMKKLGIKPKGLLEMRTATSRKMLAAMARMLQSDSPATYAHILLGQEEGVMEVRTTYRTSQDEVYRLLREGKEEGFVACMASLRKYFGNTFLAQAQEGEFDD